MSWKNALDKYLTQEPDYNFDNWCELVIEAFSEEFYNKNEDWIMDNNQCNMWLNKLYGKEPKETAKIIERAYNYYFL